MRLGIDFGTTRIVVAFVDAGNYPVVTFEPPDGTARDWFPPLIAVQGSRMSVRLGRLGGSGGARLDRHSLAQTGAGFGQPYKRGRYCRPDSFR